MSSPNISTLKTQLSTFQGDLQMCVDEKNMSFSTILNTSGLGEVSSLNLMSSSFVVFLSTSSVCNMNIQSTCYAIDTLPK
jgi:hypothetical protein